MSLTIHLQNYKQITQPPYDVPVLESQNNLFADHIHYNVSFMR